MTLEAADIGGEEKCMAVISYGVALSTAIEELLCLGEPSISGSLEEEEF